MRCRRRAWRRRISPFFPPAPKVGSPAHASLFTLNSVVGVFLPAPRPHTKEGKWPAKLLRGRARGPPRLARPSLLPFSRIPGRSSDCTGSSYLAVKPPCCDPQRMTSSSHVPACRQVKGGIQGLPVLRQPLPTALWYSRGETKRLRGSNQDSVAPMTRPKEAFGDVDKPGSVCGSPCPLRRRCFF